jgi:hypothetical protein
MPRWTPPDPPDEQQAWQPPDPPDGEERVLSDMSPEELAQIDPRSAEYGGVGRVPLYEDPLLAALLGGPPLLRGAAKLAPPLLKYFVGPGAGVAAGQHLYNKLKGE